MHNLRYILVLCLYSLLLIPTACAQVVHQPGIVLRGGYHSVLLPRGSAAGNSAGYDVGAGFSYRLDYKHMVLLTGLEAGWQVASFSPGDAEVVLKDQWDATNRLTFDYVYHTSARHDRYRSITARVPLLLGARIGDVYLAAGVTAEYMARTWSDTRYTLSTWGDYPQFLDPLTGMPEHQFYTAAAKRDEARVQLRQRLYVSAQLGYTWRTIPSITLALYADYGVWDTALGAAASATGQEPLLTPTAFSDKQDMLAPVRANHLLSTRLVAEGRVIPLTAGVRLTIAWPQLRSHAEPCRCYQW